MQILDNRLENFLAGIRSEETKKVYLRSYYRFCQFLGKDHIDLDTVESDLQSWLVYLKKTGVSFAYAHLNLSAIATYCFLNDVIVNKKKLNKFLPVATKKPKDRGYTIEEISQLLSVCDLRFKLVVYIFSSTGIRLGALPPLKLKHIKKIDNLYQFTIYENSAEEYITFCTPECSLWLEAYLEYRQRAGEKLNPNSPLIREQFDHTDTFMVNHPRHISIKSIFNTLDTYSQMAGLREVNHFDGPKSRKEVKLIHGFRKFHITTCINAEMNPDIRQLITGRKSALGVEWFYYRPNQQKMIDEYLKVVNDLTISEENRLRKEIEYYKIEKSKIDTVMVQIEEMKKKLGLNF